MRNRNQKPKTQTLKPVFAKRSLGQNFLVDQNYIDKIIDALNLQPNETVIEIGPGRGALTEKLIESGANVIAIELDRYFVPMLREQFAEHKNFTIIEADALEINFSDLIKTQDSRLKTKLVANLPYNISTAILQHLIEQNECFSELVLMLQLEVAERISAKIGNSERGFLSVMTESAFTTNKLFDVPPDAFRPIPKVNSAVVRLETLTEPVDKNFDEVNFRQIVSLGFMQKRKTILNNLKNKFADASVLLESANIEPHRRAETLTLTDWKRLANVIKN